MYAIANYLTVDQKHKALGVTYKQQYPDGKSVKPRTDHGYCPLGLCLQDEFNQLFNNDITVKTPRVQFVLLALGYKRGDLEYMDIAQDAQQFINDWDDGKITDLAEALGMTNEPSE